MMDLVTDLHAWAALATLSVLEIVLGIDRRVHFGAGFATEACAEPRAAIGPYLH